MKLDPRTTFAAAFMIVAFIIWFQTSAPPRQRASTGAVPGGTALASEQYGDLIQAFKNDLDKLKQENAELRDQTKQLLERVDQLEKR